MRTSPYTLHGNGYAAIQMADELRKTVIYSGIYETIAIVYAPQVSAKPQRVYTSENTPEAQTFFSYHYRYDQWDLQDLYNAMPSMLHPIMRAPEWVTVNRIARGRYMTYIVPLCAATTVNQRGVMLYIVPVNRFLSMLDGVNIPDEATLIMADAAGRVVLSSGSLPVADGLLLPASPAGDAPVDFSVAGEKCQLLQTETGSGQWRFALLLPEHAVADVMQARMRAIWLILGAGMVVVIDHEDRLKAHMDNTMCVLIRYSLLKVLRETAHGCAITSVGCEIGVDNSIVAVLSGDVEEMRAIRPVLEYQTLDSMRDAVAKVLYQLESKRQSTLSMQHSALIDQCVDYMQAHIADESLTIDSLAETLGISAGYLSRCFRAQMGSSPLAVF